jgi:Uma2 family endonuclease
LTNGIEGEVHHPREPIYKSAKAGATYLEPDMMYVSEELSKQMGKKRSSADIVFEYASKRTAIYDRTTKADTYLALGVRELWIIDSVDQAIEVRVAGVRDGRMVWELSRYSSGGAAESRILSGWKVSVDELFAGLTED